MFQDILVEYLYRLSFYGVIQEDPKYGQKVIVDVTSKNLDQIFLLTAIFSVWVFPKFQIC